MNTGASTFLLLIVIGSASCKANISALGKKSQSNSQNTNAEIVAVEPTPTPTASNTSDPAPSASPVDVAQFVLNATGHATLGDGCEFSQSGSVTKPEGVNWPGAALEVTGIAVENISAADLGYSAKLLNGRAGMQFSALWSVNNSLPLVQLQKDYLLDVATYKVPVLNGEYSRAGGIPASDSKCKTAGGPLGIHAHEKHTCVIAVDGRVMCWGDRSSGTLGDGHYSNSPLFVEGVSGISGNEALQISGGTNHSCVRLDSGKIKCWGKANLGQLGNGAGTTDAYSATEVSVIDGSSSSARAVYVAAGNDVTCAALESGAVYCWGAAANGLLADGQNSVNNIVPEPANVIDGSSQNTKAQTIAMGLNHACALMQDGTLKCWGAATNGRLGNGSTSPSQFSPVNVLVIDGSSAGLTAVEVETSPGAAHACARLQNGNVMCWGLGSSGQLGDGGTTSRSSPVTVVDGSANPISNVIDVAVGDFHTCALLTGGAVKCWGRATNGALGNGETSPNRLNPVDVIGIDGAVGRKAIAIAAGGNSTCALLENRTVKCWGTANDGQLGNGTFAATSAPNVPVNFLGETNSDLVNSLGMGRLHACAVTNSKQVKCWGAAGNGRLGRATANRSLTPVYVRGISGVAGDQAVQLSGGNPGFTCARLDSGGVKCWGSSSLGQLGNGSTNKNFSGAVQVLGVDGTSPDKTAVSIGSTYTATVALMADGSVKAWGDGIPHGSLSGPQPTPVVTTVFADVPDTSVRMVRGGENFGCVVISNGRIKCWGIAAHGRLGNGDSTTSRYESSYVLGIDGSPDNFAVSVDANHRHACTILSTGRVKCWGGNADSGQGGSPLGAGDLLTAVEVQGIDGSAGNKATALALGNEFSCALLDSGKITCWGAELFGVFGNGSTTGIGQKLDLPYIDLTPTTKAIALAAGRFHLCVVVADGTIRCSGQSTEGQLGNGIIEAERAQPVYVLSPSETVGGVPFSGNARGVPLMLR